MQGKKERASKLFYSVSLDALVPQGHPMRRIAEVLDLRFLYEQTRPYYSHEGKPSIDPVVLFKFHIIGYFFGITSERRLFQEAQVNLAYRWYLGYDLDEPLPDHSILSKARVRFPQSVFAAFFARIIELCKQRGLISGEMQFIDSSLVRADASKESFYRMLPQPSEYLRTLDETEDQCPREKRSYVFDGEVNPQKMGRRRKKAKKNDQRYSATDPGAKMITRPTKGTFPAYKAHLCVDRKRRVILAVTGSVATDDDMSAIDPLFTAAYIAAGRKPTTVVADKHYGGIEALKYYQDQSVSTCIHPRIADNRKGSFKNNDFHVNADESDCRCPTGKHAQKKVRNKFRVQFRFAAEDCRSCSVRSRCTDSPGGRMITYYQGGYFARAAKLADSSHGKRLLRARQIVVEGVIAEAKTLHGLARCRYRGLQKLQIQLLLTAAVINIKRLLQRSSHMHTSVATFKSAIRTMSFFGYLRFI